MQRINTNGEVDIISDYQGNKRLDTKAAMQVIKELSKHRELTPVQVTLLAELESYLSKHFRVE